MSSRTASFSWDYMLFSALLINSTAQFSGHSHSSSSIAFCNANGFCPSTLQPTALQVPNTSLQVPLNSLARLFDRIWRTMLKNWALDKLPLCLMFLVFFRSLRGSFSSLMTRLVAFGSTSTFAARFWIVKPTVILMPFQAAVPFTMSSPIFLGDIPRGPTFGASTDEGACSPPYWRRQTIFTSLGSNFGAILGVGTTASGRGPGQGGRRART